MPQAAKSRVREGPQLGVWWVSLLYVLECYALQDEATPAMSGAPRGLQEGSCRVSPSDTQAGPQRKDREGKA